MKKIKEYLKYRISRVELIFITTFNNLIHSINGEPKVKSIDDTIDDIIKMNYSVSRYGDGEFTLMEGSDLRFQHFDINLAARLKEIIKSNDINHIVCIPGVFENKNELSSHTRQYWDKFINRNRFKIYRFLDLNKNYYNAFITRVYMELNDKHNAKNRFDSIKKIWKNKDLVIVEGDKSRLGLGNDLFDNSNSIKRIICPSKNAFSQYSNIINSIQKHSKDKLILIALGPTATVLAYDLAKLGYQAIDIGHIDIEYEWMKKGVLAKCIIKNKYVDEVDGGQEVTSNIDDYIYINQVVEILL